MTMRQVDACLRRIDKRLQSQLQFEAAIHGINLAAAKEETGPIETTKLTAEQERAVDAAIEESRARKRMELSRGR